MKILIVYRSLHQGGVQRMMVNFSNHLASKGHDVTLLLVKQEGAFLTLIDERVKIDSFKTKNKLKYFSELSNYLKKNQFNILFTATLSLNILCVLSVKLSRIKTRIIISERINTFKELSKGKFELFKLGFIFIPLVYRFADRIVAVSEGVKDDLKKIALIPAERIKVIYNPAYDRDLDYQITEAVDEDWLIEKKMPVVIGAGRLAEQKNFELLVRSISVLHKQKFFVRLIIIGDGDLRKDLENLVTDLGLNDFIKLVGFKMNPIAWISKADVFALPSLWEGFGNIVVDALAARTTIVSTNCKSGPAEILDNGKYGYLLSSFDPEEMASKIKEALHNPTDKKLLQSRAELFEKNYIMLQYEGLIKEVYS